MRQEECEREGRGMRERTREEKCKRDVLAYACVCACVCVCVYMYVAYICTYMRIHMYASLDF